MTGAFGGQAVDGFYTDAWGLDRVDGQGVILNGKYAYNKESDGHGARVYIIDTVSVPCQFK